MVQVERQGKRQSAAPAAFINDNSKVWDRLFDHKGFLGGEITFTLREFEQKREDAKVETLFGTIENITNIKDTQIIRLKEVVDEKVLDANQHLSTALVLCSTFAELEEKYKQSTQLEKSRLVKKKQWEKFMDEITSEYSKTNSYFEEKELEVKKIYEDLKKNNNKF